MAGTEPAHVPGNDGRWRTSCPRLPVWEDATDRRLVEIAVDGGRSTVRTTSAGLTLLSGSPRTATRTNLRAATAALAALAAAAAAGPASGEGRLPREEAVAACMSIRQKIVPCAEEYARQAVDQHLALTGKRPSPERKKMEAKVRDGTIVDGSGPEAARRKHCENMLNQIDKGGAVLTKDSVAAMDSCFKADGCKAQMSCIFSESAKLIPPPKAPAR